MKFLHGICMVILLGMAVEVMAGQEVNAGDGLKSLQRFAVAQCLAESYKGKELGVDALAAAGGYFEMGTYGADHYFAVQDFAARWAREKKYIGKHDADLSVMKCLDLFDSPELLKIIKKQDQLIQIP